MHFEFNIVPQSNNMNNNHNINNSINNNNNKYNIYKNNP